MLLESLQVRNLLSFGPTAEPVVLRPLNVLIGANATGKSNLIQAVEILRSASEDLERTIWEAGGLNVLLWNGEAAKNVAELEVVARIGQPSDSLRYRLCLAARNGRPSVVDETIEKVAGGTSYAEPPVVFRYQDGAPALSLQAPTFGTSVAEAAAQRRDLRPVELDPHASVLAQRRDPLIYPELTQLAAGLADMRIYSDLSVARHAPARQAQPIDLPESVLLEDGRNLAHVLRSILRGPDHGGELIGILRRVCPEVETMSIVERDGLVMLTLEICDSETPVPTSRLSGGTLRLLYLLAILCHPDPPPLICLEDPEVGLHPDVVVLIGELLIEASERTQLIVTTHSEVLVSSLGEVPGCLVVCEKDEGGTRLQRLDEELWAEWLEESSLGDLWRMGELGGNP